MKPIFISYRRDDNISAAKLLKAILESELGRDTVFLDTTTMGPGEKWRETLKDAVTKARIVIALIGPYWKGEKYWKTKKAEDNRLMNSEDWVRLELETALQDKTKKIIPMIFHPDKIEDFNDSIHFTKDTLPFTLFPLAGDNNKAIIHEKRFEDDLKRTTIEISPFINTGDVLAELPLPDFDLKNPLDFLPENPYKGLDYFTEQDARIFFGRDEHIKELFYKLLGNQLVLFYGQSGVGKSSLLFAGLKRRMQGKGWSIEYLRRKPTSNLAEELDVCVSNTANQTSSLVILDQIEEIYTNPSKVFSLENEKFQLIESIENALKKNIRILLSFREEYLAKIQELLDTKSIRYGKYPLRHMQVKGVLEAIEGITKTPELKYNYNLSYEGKKDLPQKIAYLVLNDKQSHVAPLLQLLLRKLWDRIASNAEERIITEKLFDEVKIQSLNEMLNKQVESLRERFSEEIDSGLVLDLLYFFTTPSGTSTSHTNEELNANYDHVRIIELTESLKNKYLLTGFQDENIYKTRLAHDSLAPMIREQYSQSNRPSQRAYRLLESKSQDIDSGNDVEFSKLDLTIIDAGKTGMRMLTFMEIQAIDKNVVRIRSEESDKKFREEQRRKEQLRLQFEEAEVNSIKIEFSPYIFEDICHSIKQESCLFISGDRLVQCVDNSFFITSIYEKAIKDYSKANLILNQKTNLISGGDNWDLRDFPFRLQKYFETMPNVDSELLSKFIQIPFNCYINLFFDSFLIPLLREQNIDFKFSYYSDHINRKITDEIEELTTPTKQTPLLYNLFGSIADNASIAVTEDKMNRLITSIQKGYLPTIVRSIIRSANTIIFVGINWEAWYNQSVIRLLLNDLSEKTHCYTLIDNITVDSVGFLRSLDIRAIDIKHFDLVNLIYSAFEKENLLRTSIIKNIRRNKSLG